MQSNDDLKNDSQRIAIAVFIVATTLTILQVELLVPSILLVPIGAFLAGLLIAAVFAFLFILAKGYELRYGKIKDNLIDKYNYLLYNSAMTAYIIVMLVIGFIYVFKYFNDLSKTGNAWGTVGVTVLFIAIIGIINKKDVKELARVVLGYINK